MTNQILLVKLDRMTAEPRPLDKGIMNSLAAVGQLYPVIALLKDDNWIVWDGHTRVRAARELGWSDIKVLPANNEMEAERKAAAITLAANLRAYNPLAEGRALDELGDDDYAMGVAGLTRAEIAARRRLLALAPEYQAMVEDGRLALTAAKKLCGLPIKDQHKAYQRAKRLMRIHNEERRREERDVPTIGEMDQAVRAVKGEMQPAIPDMANRLKKTSAGPDPVALAARIRQVASNYDGGPRIVLQKAADILENK